MHRFATMEGKGRREERHGGPANRRGNLKRLEPLVGEWALEAKPPDGPPWPGEARATIEWHDSGAHLVARSTVDMPGAPDSVSVMGCDAANGTYFQLYSDERGVCSSSTPTSAASAASSRWA